MTHLLGIETSCDETAAAIIRDGREILSNVVSSSLNDHRKYGGIIPEIASRRQMELIHAVVDEALQNAGIPLADIDAIAVTTSPGLIGSLLVGISFARALSFATGKPLIEVNHVHAHLYANFLVPADQAKPPRLPQLPAIGLVVSGGHSSIFHVKSFRDIRPIGQTRDDAAGEAFDKVARILELGYPGGPAIDHLAKQGKNKDVRFRCAQLPETNDFSFSGIKTAVLYYVRDPENNHVPKAKIAYAFQESIISVLAEKCVAACRQANVTTLLVGGGVAANSALRERLTELAGENHLDLFFPPINLCIDNAAMIGGMGSHFLKAKGAKTLCLR